MRLGQGQPEQGAIEPGGPAGVGRGSEPAGWPQVPQLAWDPARCARICDVARALIPDVVEAQELSETGSSFDCAA